MASQAIRLLVESVRAGSHPVHHVRLDYTLVVRGSDGPPLAHD